MTRLERVAAKRTGEVKNYNVDLKQNESLQNPSKPGKTHKTSQRVLHNEQIFLQNE
jgi:hypothetical protein